MKFPVREKSFQRPVVPTASALCRPRLSGDDRECQLAFAFDDFQFKESPALAEKGECKRDIALVDQCPVGTIRSSA